MCHLFHVGVWIVRRSGDKCHTASWYPHDKNRLYTGFSRKEERQRRTRRAATAARPEKHVSDFNFELLEHVREEPCKQRIFAFCQSYDSLCCHSELSRIVGHEGVSDVDNISDVIRDRLEYSSFSPLQRHVDVHESLSCLSPRQDGPHGERPTADHGGTVEWIGGLWPNARVPPVEDLRRLEPAVRHIGQHL